MDSVRAEKFFSEIQNGGVLIGGWQVIELLGNGKSAVVFSAKKGETTAALKVMDPEVVERFGYESQKARIALQVKLVGCDHPNLVRIIEAGECECSGYLYVAMEKLPYRALSELITEFPLEKVLPLLMQLVSACKFLEELGLAHRDIKPENIVLSTDLNHAILLDFGVVKPLIGAVDNGTGGELMGTLRYSPPEFALGTHSKERGQVDLLLPFRTDRVAHRCPRIGANREEIR